MTDSSPTLPSDATLRASQLRHRAPILLAATVVGLAACSHAATTDASAPTSPVTDSARSISVTLNGQPHEVADGTSLSELLEDAGISTTRASLLDIDGELLKRHAVEPTYAIDGEPATATVLLASGDAVTVRPAKDAQEPLARERIIGGLPSNPEFAMGGDRGVYVVESGKVSGKIASVTFAEGKGRYQSRVVALTFDDGPDPEMTPLILHILAREEILATFFVTGQQAEANPDLIRQILAAGHEVGTHSWSHPTQPPFNQLDSVELVQQVHDPVEALEELGYTPHLFRPPGGSYDEAVVAAAAQAGMRTIMWSIGTGDFVDDVPPHHIMNAVLARLRPGGIILLHDADGSSTLEHTATVKVLPNLIEEIRQRGYEFVPLEPYLSPDGAV